MTLAPADLALYAFAMLVLFITPGPVWVALVARSLSGGFHAAWPLAVGVAIGDLLWPFCAIIGVSWILSIYGGFLELLKWVACGTFILMGVLVYRSATRPIHTSGALTRPGQWAGFAAGLAVIIGNPKAILFYMGMLPGFFDIATVTPLDIAAICFVSFAIPLTGNLIMAVSIHQARRLLTSPERTARINRFAGGLLVLVGLMIPFL
ncbi:MAG: LysE family translocator [Marivivens sp.]|jgi:threonine/homoserine/homoserine lactone efflux protein|nr:LysE family translocator [Marivivens sp.]